jgi:glycyl-tRNA synthetase beta chain
LPPDSTSSCAAPASNSPRERYATPRRLALRVEQIAAEQPERVETRRGPALGAAFDASGAPTKAAQGFARSCGVEVSALGRLKSDEGEWLSFEQRVAGRRLFDVLPEMVNQRWPVCRFPSACAGARTAPNSCDRCTGW